LEESARRPKSGRGLPHSKTLSCDLKPQRRSSSSRISDSDEQVFQIGGVIGLAISPYVETTNEHESTRIRESGSYGRLRHQDDMGLTREFVSIGVHSWLNSFES
jgi:hypothetical protein